MHRGDGRQLGAALGPNPDDDLPGAPRQIGEVPHDAGVAQVPVLDTTGHQNNVPKPTQAASPRIMRNCRPGAVRLRSASSRVRLLAWSWP